MESTDAGVSGAPPAPEVPAVSLDAAEGKPENPVIVSEPGETAESRKSSLVKEELGAADGPEFDRLDPPPIEPNATSVEETGAVPEQPAQLPVIQEPAIPSPDLPRKSVLKDPSRKDSKTEVNKVNVVEPIPAHSSLSKGPRVSILTKKVSIAPVLNSAPSPAPNKPAGRKFTVKDLTNGKNVQNKSIVQSMSGMSVSVWPSSMASIRDRASNVNNDMMDIMSMQGFDDDDNEEEEDPYSLNLPSGYVSPGGTWRPSHGILDIPAGLEKAELLNIDEWMNIDKSGEYVGKRRHFLRIINTLDYDEKLLEVCNFMTVNDVINFYQTYNSNCRQYLWKDIFGTTLSHHRSLGDNGLHDYSLFTDETGLDHFPTILLYFKDGFENDPPMHLDISKPRPNRFNAPCRNY